MYYAGKGGKMADGYVLMCFEINHTVKIIYRSSLRTEIEASSQQIKK